MRTKIVLLSLVIIFGIFASPLFAVEERQAHLEFLNTPCINGNTIELREICEVKSEDPYFLEVLRSITVTSTPVPGKEKTITKFEVLASLKKAGFSAWDVKFTGKVRTKFSFNSQEISSENIIASAKEYILNESGYDKENIIFEILNHPHDLLVPKGKTYFEVYPLSSSVMVGNVFLSVNVIVDKKIIETVPVTIKVRAFKDVLVSRKTLTRGQTIRSSHFEMRRREITRCRKEIIENFDDISKMVPKRSIRSQQIISADMFEYPDLIKKGEIVKIILKSGSLTITTKGIALNNGRHGDMIRIKNIDTKRIINAVVAGKSSARLSI